MSTNARATTTPTSGIWCSPMAARSPWSCAPRSPPPAGSADMADALHGLRVLDLSETVAGQFCARMLADHGAEVTLLEPPGGSAVRSMAPFDPQHGDSLLFFHVNLGKRSMLLDTGTPAGGALLLRL